MPGSQERIDALAHYSLKGEVPGLDPCGTAQKDQTTAVQVNEQKPSVALKFCLRIRIA